MNQAVILYGPPASGKDTVTKYLITQGFAHFERLKHGPGRTAGYRMINASELARIMSTSDGVLWLNSRYDSTYVVDRTHLTAILASGQVPILHLGQPEAIDAIRRATSDVRWLVVELWCPREIAIRRMIDRATNDLPERIQAYDDTPLLPHPDLQIDTFTTSPDAAALQIHQAIYQR